MNLRWLVCGAGNLHIVGRCPNCYASQGGLLLGTVSGIYKGRVTASCLDCSTVEDYYVDAPEEKIWKLELVTAKGLHVDL